MKHIAQNFRGHYKEIILGPLFKLFEAVLELFVPLVMANIIDVGIRNSDVPYILKNGALMLLLAALGAAAGITCQYYAAKSAGAFGHSLRKQLYRHVMKLSSHEVDLYGAGGLITRVTNDSYQVQTGVNQFIRLATRVPFLAIGSIVMAIVLNWRIGLIFLAATPVIAIILYVIMRKTLPRYVDIQRGQDTLNRLSGENLAGARVIRAFSRQKRERAEFENEGDSLTALTIRVGRISSLLNPLTTVVVNIAIMGIVWLGSSYAFNGTVAPGEIIALVNYMNQTLLAMLVAVNLIIIFTRSIASTKRVAQVLDMQPDIVDGAGAVENPSAPAVAFENVTFAYHAQADPAVEHISFIVPHGQTIGIIGGTGSGKTTLANLMVRYFDVTDGSIKINGDDVKNYALATLRGKIGLVPQTATLFSGTVRSNLCLGNGEVEDEDLWQALEVAQGAEFVRNMPDGLDTIIEESGKNLSGGQRQRLTIARALVKNPEILILDDSASALDYATDAALRRALREQTQNMTTVIISQRASALMHAAQILVLDDGQMVGMGTHNELLLANEVYREICASQGLLEEEVAG